MPPNRAAPASTIARTASWLVTSVTTAKARSGPSSTARASRRSLRRAASTTFAPSAANRRAIPAPMPEPAPVTTTVLPVKRWSIVSSQSSVTDVNRVRN